MEIIRIPTERVKNLIGEGGDTKKMLEKKCQVKIEVDEEGEVHIEGDAIDEFFAKDVVKAVGRGFRAEDAMKLLAGNYNLLIIDLRDFLSSDKALKRIKARVIGEKGKVKKEIEDATGSVLSIYGHTIGIISRMDSIEYAHAAIVKLLDGAPHSTVIRYLGKVRKKILSERLRNQGVQ
jgi:ribosomal RNA assembly protein